MKKSGIYTKGGDRGETSLVGGKRVPKQHDRIEAYGTVDELMAHTALLRDMVEDAAIKDALLTILDRLMVAASILASDDAVIIAQLPALKEEDITGLEQSIDVMDNELPPLKSFILPGGDPVVSQAHIARTVCRRSERMILRVAENEDVEALIIKYFNRLSDYYFLLSRKLSYDLGLEELPWNT